MVDGVAIKAYLIWKKEKKKEHKKSWNTRLSKARVVEGK